jgi:hypothetical protein
MRLRIGAMRDLAWRYTEKGKNIPKHREITVLEAARLASENVAAPLNPTTTYRW